MHPAEELRGTKGSKLSGKRIILGVTGSIAAVETVRLARELIRHGAEVIPVMTQAATRILHPDALEFATGHAPLLSLTGKTEHVSYCGLVKKPVDLLLVSPCTANTLSKIALGIDDSPVTTFATTALGSGVPVMLVPAMHLSMYKHKVVQEHMKTCLRMDVTVVDPVLSGTKAKMSEVDDLVHFVIRRIGPQDFTGKKILIIGGATAEPIDDIRVLTNSSSGKTTIALAITAFERGADVEVWNGNSGMQIPHFIPCKYFKTIDDLVRLCKRPLDHFDYIFMCAALANYIPKKVKGKIPSGKEKLIIECDRAPTVLSLVTSQAPQAKVIAFKAEEKKRDLRRKALQLLRKHRLEAVVANTLEAFGDDKTEIVFVNRRGVGIWKQGKKEDVAYQIFDLLHS